MTCPCFYRFSIRFVFILLVFCDTLSVSSQRIVDRYAPQTDSLRVSDDLYLPYFERGHTLLLPDPDSVIRGVLVCLTDRPVNLDPEDNRSLVHPHALPLGLAVLYIATGVPVDLYLDEASLRYVDAALEEILTNYGLANTPQLLFGAMVDGHRALKYLEYVATGRSGWSANLRGAAIAESPLDWVRMWYEGDKQVRDSLNPVKYFEGNLIRTVFAEAWGVTPKEDLQRYADFSSYTYFETHIKRQEAFRYYALRAYTHMPINYWNTLNGNGVNDCNYPDMCGFINEQHLAGNPRAELIVSDPALRRATYHMKKQTDTWLEVDKAELVEWALRVMEE